MSRPLKTPQWATDTNFPAGADPWSATPTKSEPSSGKKGTGFVPNTDDAAEEDNWIINNVTTSAAYLDSAISGSNFVVVDDFVGPTIDPSIWNTTDLIHLTNVDDHAAFGSGALRINATTTGAAYAAFTNPLYLDSLDFRFSAVVRDSTAGAGQVLAGLISAVAAEDCFFQQRNINALPTHWYACVGTVGPGVDTGIAVSATYQKLEIFRSGGTVYFLINGVVVYSVAFATSLTQSKLAAQNNDSGGGAGSFFVDVIKLWFDR